MSDAQDKDLQTFNELQRKFIEHTEKQKIVSSKPFQARFGFRKNTTPSLSS